MKTLGGRPEAILATGVATAAECLGYAMSLPVATVCSGMDSLEKLQQNADIARQFAPLADDERLALLSRTKALGMQAHTSRTKLASPDRRALYLSFPPFCGTPVGTRPRRCTSQTRRTS